jgi:hypothetical protein
MIGPRAKGPAASSISRARRRSSPAQASAIRTRSRSGQTTGENNKTMGSRTRSDSVIGAWTITEAAAINLRD